MCLISIKLTKKASEGPEPQFFYSLKERFKDFFSKCDVVSYEKVNDRFLLRVYVHWPENAVSIFINGALLRVRGVEKASIIS
jgi:hypothetical protein